MNHRLIYVFSGTGNGLSAAKWMQTKFHEHEQKTNITLIQKGVKFNNNYPNYGLIYPAHGFGLPWLVLKFILALPKGKGRNVFLVNPRAGSKIGKIQFPGISGMALLLPIIILKLKGWKINGILPLDTPSNWVSLHPAYSDNAIYFLMNKCRKTLNDFADKLAAGLTVYSLKFFLSLPIDVLLLPIYLGYMCIGRFFLAKTFIASHKCNACGICIKNCPTKSISMKNGSPYWDFSCESCMRCLAFCPRNAITTSHSLALLVILVPMAFPLTQISMDFIIQLNPGLFNTFYGIIYLTVMTFLSIPLFWIVYFIVHQLKRWKPINLFFEYSSFTRWWKKYKAPGIKIRDFSEE